MAELTCQANGNGAEILLPPHAVGQDERAPVAAQEATYIPRKRIIVCCDGTWNDSVSSDSPLTNVSRISRLITAVDERNGLQQILSYYTGVGSGTSKLGSIQDGMSGRGITRF